MRIDYETYFMARSKIILAIYIWSALYCSREDGADMKDFAITTLITVGLEAIILLTIGLVLGIL